MGYKSKSDKSWSKSGSWKTKSDKSKSGHSHSHGKNKSDKSKSGGKSKSGKYGKYGCCDGCDDGYYGYGKTKGGKGGKGGKYGKCDKGKSGGKSKSYKSYKGYYGKGYYSKKAKRTADNLLTQEGRLFLLQTDFAMPAWYNDFRVEAPLSPMEERQDLLNGVNSNNNLVIPADTGDAASRPVTVLSKLNALQKIDDEAEPTPPEPVVPPPSTMQRRPGSTMTMLTALDLPQDVVSEQQQEAQQPNAPIIRHADLVVDLGITTQQVDLDPQPEAADEPLPMMGRLAALGDLSF